jgi:DNA-binding SARP family transcriptional activator
LDIRLLGAFRVAWPGRETSCHLSPRAQAFFAFLVLHPGRQFRRDVLAGTFWGASPEDKARASLRSTLWRLRRVLEPEGIAPGAYLHTTGASDVSFNNDSNYELDVRTFERGIEASIERSDQALTDTLLAQVEGGLDCYSGDLLEGLDDDWILPERERLRCAYINALACQMHNLKLRGRYEPALACGRRILAHEPLRESVHREMMRLYAQSGGRAEALRHYTRCAELLRRELAIEPMPATRALYNEIRAHQAQESQVPPTAAPEPRSTDAESFLATALDDLANALNHIRSAAARVAQADPAAGSIKSPSV